MEHVMRLVNEDKTIEPKVYKNVKQKHIGKGFWKRPDNTLLTLQQKQQFIAALHNVNSVEGYMNRGQPEEGGHDADMVGQGAMEVDLDEGGGQVGEDAAEEGGHDADEDDVHEYELCDADMYEKFEGTMKQLCTAITDDMSSDEEDCDVDNDVDNDVT
jgi:hypothetical protein